MDKCGKTKGFTLIEILVVLGLMAAIFSCGLFVSPC
jgi:prepilin-type N-terminal cleavage/methylation domain-containing protein